MRTLFDSISTLALCWLLASAASAVPGPEEEASPHGELGVACASCHTVNSWTELREPLEFDHQSTGFALLQGHEDLSCRTCHESLVFAAIPTSCLDCHADPHDGDLGPRCESCHTADGWGNRRLVYDYHSTTLFPLTGAHAATDCGSCHRLEPPFEFSSTPTDCFFCHVSDYETSTRPNHARVGFSTQCEECHTTNAWLGSRFSGGPGFDHSTFFVLAGAHQSASCGSCHQGEIFAGTPRDCFSCHQSDFTATAAPNHAAAGFATACESCHTESGWQGASFDHEPVFQLVGAHQSVDCISCHVGEVYAGTPRDCFGCHRPDFEATTDPNHRSAGFATSCESCHDETGWEGATFDHSTVFELEGAHQTADCESCHLSGVYAGTPRECFACHQSDYEGTVDPNHASAGFPTSCESCHDESSWEGAAFDHDTVFELVGAHRSADCASCHVGGVYTGTPRECFACHQPEYEATADPDHVSAGFPTSCESCHDESGWEGAEFDHAATFELLGAHQAADCGSCHVGGVYTGTSRDCFSCHSADYDATTEPDHLAAGLGTSCESCHDTFDWLGASTDHDEFFPLTGAHRRLDCESCHADGFEGTPTDCFSCHAPEYNATEDPNHSAAGFPITCEECHGTASWTDATFDHTAWVLTGAHIRASCEACHADGFEGTPTECFSCHSEDYDATSDPNHREAGFATSCEDCHGTDSWQGAAVGHESFALVGGHDDVACETCHTDGYEGTPTDCYACHLEDYESTTDPDHVEAGFATSCEDCHDVFDWAGAAIDHDEYFPLTGAHRQIECESCHADGYDGTPTDCYSCHASDYNRTDDPNHSAAGFPITCEDCHGTSNWDATFDHDAWGLTGAHALATCESCHVDGFDGTPTECFSCHAEDYDGTTDPNHRQAGFPTDCEDCHNTSDWDDADFDHDELFALVGGHSGLACESCHADGYEGTPTDCYSCHVDDYEGTVDPDHADAGFPTSCEDCHGVFDWNDATFDHDEVYPLTGAHRQIECESCHADGYDGTPTDCYSCHASDYNRTDDPNHSAAGFPLTCEDCHDTSNWDATFDHDAWALTGAHAALTCESCHADGYDGTPTDCFSCHSDDYNRTTDPDHRAAGFPTACEDCHNTSNWDDATFDHDALFFPIYSGDHKNKWDNCDECHVVPSNFAVFECIECHEHRQSEVDDEHSEVPGYVYDSQSCYSCHPDGNS